jgi:hypothetical protein
VKLSRHGFTLTAVTILLLACAHRVERKLETAAAAATLDRRSPFLKIHARDGRLWVLAPWHVDDATRSVTGRGQLYGADRAPLDSGSFTVTLDSVALFETNVVDKSPSNPVFAALTVVTGAVAVACIANPKACFGSCPTFYGVTPRGEQLLAEGFSASVAPSLEAADLDALAPALASRGTLTLRMRNEAWETHVVRHVRLLAAPRAEHERVFATGGGQFVQADGLASPGRCAAAEGDCRAALIDRDGVERTSSADSTDLATRETIDLEFAAPAGPGEYGLVIAYRQTLLTTYLFYQGLAWMGDRAGEWLAALDRTPALRGTASSLAGVLGKVEVQVPRDDGWTAVGAVGETGPLATDVKVVPLPPQAVAGPVRVRLRLTRGLWRLDHVALARLGARVTPTRLRPARATATRHEPEELSAWIADSTRALVTLPGDDVTLEFAVPDAPRTELFLEARGYYLEWMRQEWLAEAAPLKAARLYLDPQGALRELAPTFSRLEPGLERTFWSSRYARQ